MGRKRKRDTEACAAECGERVVATGCDEGDVMAEEPWRFHLQVASYRLLPVTVRVARGAAAAKRRLNDDDRKCVALMLKKYLVLRVERVWCVSPSVRKTAVEEISCKRRCISATQLDRMQGLPPPRTARVESAPVQTDETFHLRLLFRPTPARSVLQTSITQVSTSPFPLKRYAVTPNELIVEVACPARTP